MEFGYFCSKCGIASHPEDLDQETGLCYECEVEYEAQAYEAELKYDREIAQFA